MSKTVDTESAVGLRPRFFGRRRGKTLRNNALGRMSGLLPRLAIAIPEPGAAVDPSALFAARPVEVWLEVGFGNGEHLAELALARPDIGLIGAEVFQNGVAALLAHLEDGGQTNVRIFPEDIRLLFPALPDGCLHRVFVLFPDPWPKARHAERRFIGPETLDELARLLADGGQLRVASDDPVYVAWAARHLEAHPCFTQCLATTARELLPADWPATRYEKKCLAGKRPTFFLYVRKPR